MLNISRTKYRNSIQNLIYGNFSNREHIQVSNLCVRMENTKVYYYFKIQMFIFFNIN